MIAISAENGKLIRFLSLSGDDGVFGFHPVLGFVSRQGAEGRLRSRKAKGLKTRERWSFEVERDGKGLRALSGCEITKGEDGRWTLATALGRFFVADVDDAAALASATGLSERALLHGRTGDGRLFEKSLGIAVAAVVALFVFLPKHAAQVEPETISEPVEVKMVPEIQKSVRVPDLGLALPHDLAKQMTAKAKVAVAQNLGFLSMLGRKDLTKALGGMPTVPGASAGAGAGGKAGSGGELLVGLGEGVTRTTVGNTGVAGLGGVGTKGVGGGGGGYGTSYLGSGNGRGLSSVPLSQDMILEGGLDRSVIQATIAKYLNQIRACYEEGLRRTPGLIGQVSIAFDIAGTGAVDAASVSKSSLGDAEVEQCMAGKVRGWQFPKPRGGVNVKVNYPFMLRPVKS